MDPEEQEISKLDSILENVDISSLSSLSSVVGGIIKAINEPGSTAKDIKDIVEIDPPLAAKVLRAANSAYYAPLKRIAEIKHAVILIGFEGLKELVMSQKVAEVFESADDVEGFSGNDLWRHSVSVALLGKMTYRREFGMSGENIYAVGLLHDIGLIIEKQFLAENFALVLEEVKQKQVNLHSAEAAILGVTHSDLGRALTERWRFPTEFSTAIGHHHDPLTVEKDFARMTMTLYVADQICQQKGMGYRDRPVKGQDLFGTCLRRLALGPHALDLIAADVAQEIKKMEEKGIL